MPASPDLATLQIDDFTPHCETVFDMQTQAGVLPLKLFRIDRTGDSGRPQYRRGDPQGGSDA